MKAIDTNVLLRLVVEDDPAQTAAAEHFIRGGAWVSILAVAEAVWVLSTNYGFSSQNISEALSILLEHPQLTFQETDAVAEALALYRNAPALGFSDCLMIALARKAGHLPLGTFDRRLGKVDGAQIIGGKSPRRPDLPFRPH